MGDTKVPSPGEILQDRFLEPNGITPYRLAQAIGKPQSTISLIMSGKRGITAEMASLLGKALGTSAEFWMDVDARYQLDKLNGENMEQVDKLVNEETNGEFVENGGWTFTTRTINDAMLGRALRGAYAAASNINPTEREMLLGSINNYIMYSIISVPGSDEYFAYKEDVPVNAIGIYEQFLINAGEDPDNVKEIAHNARVVMYQMAGMADIDGNSFPINRRSVKKVDIRCVGKLMCMACDLDDEGRDEVLGCLFSYTHNETIVFPDDDEAADIFEDFLGHCEGWQRAKQLREIYETSVKDNPENYDGNKIFIQLDEK